jgi:hypothetical protein
MGWSKMKPRKILRKRLWEKANSIAKIALSSLEPDSCFHSCRCEDFIQRQELEKDGTDFMERHKHSEKTCLKAREAKM